MTTTATQTRNMSQANGPTLRKEKANGAVNGGVNGRANGSVGTSKTDYSRWRLENVRGCQIWKYMESDEACEKWPQSVADKYHLGMETNQPDLPPAKTPLQCASNGLSFFSKLQLDPGNWACDYGGPMFLLPGLVITWYVTETPIPAYYATEMKAYLFARAHAEDGGWGLHIEGESSVFGIVMNYTALRILGVDAEDERMRKARSTLWKLGGALRAPHWAKFWMAVLGVVEWDVVNPVPPELWLLPDWVPFAPWRWWIHMRQVFCPMSFVYSRRWSYPLNDFTRQLRSELLTQPFETITFAKHRNDISPTDNYHPKSWFLCLLFWLVINVWQPFIRTAAMAKKAEDRVCWLIDAEDENTDYACLGPVNSTMNTLVAYIRGGKDSHAFREHLKTLPEFLWVKNEGMLMNGTNGVQSWDTALLVEALNAAGLTQDPKWTPMLTKALEFLEDQQIDAECRDQQLCYRQQRKGAWGFSTKKQGYTVSDCTSEGLKAVLILQSLPEYPKLVSQSRMEDAVDVLLTMQNKSGGCASYEPTRGSVLLEHLNAAEVFGRIMIEYDYPECTTSVITALHAFQKHCPTYRAAEVSAFKERAVDYIRAAQAPDGSWYGSWGICFSYAAYFALEALACAGETHANSERVRRACKFFLDHQMEDGGWGETYRACETGVWCQHPESQIVQTAWIVIALLSAQYPDPEPLRRAVKLIMSRQLSTGEWPQEAIEGVFNKTCMISYPNYKFIFPVMALGKFARRFGDEALV